MLLAPKAEPERPKSISTKERIMKRSMEHLYYNEKEKTNQKNYVHEIVRNANFIGKLAMSKDPELLFFQINGSI